MACDMRGWKSPWVRVLLRVALTEHRTSGVIEDLLRYHVLVDVFDADPHAWLAYLEERGSLAQRRGDLSFVQELILHSAADPEYLPRIRLFVALSTELLLPRLVPHEH